MSKKNIFIEGTQGSGKTTLTSAIAAKDSSYTAFREGDLSPVELAWCAYMTEGDYKEALEKFSEIKEEIIKNMQIEGDMRIVSYTRVLAEQRAFYEYMESFEIYDARVPFDRFKEILLQRYRNLEGNGNVFECSLFQNSIESMLLFYEMTEDEIVDFYREVYEILKEKEFFLIYLKAEDLEESISHICRERVDDKGEEVWYKLITNYIKSSPYGKHHSMESFEDYIAHLKRRVRIEERVMEEMSKEQVLILPAKEYEIEEVMRIINC